MIPVVDRIKSGIHVTGNGCWEWRGAKTRDGYGRIKLDGKARRVHRVMYEQVVGNIAGRLTIDHLCRNRACVNPDHLEVVTNRENTLRGFGPAAENARKEACPRGHAYSPENTILANIGGGRIARRCRTCRREA